MVEDEVADLAVSVLKRIIRERDERIAELEAALLAIKRLCSGERQPNWADNMAVTQTRMRIADLCEIADQK